VGEPVLTVLKIAAGLAALAFVLIALVAVAGGLVALVRRAIRGPGVRPTGLLQPPGEDSSSGRDDG
jgi:hypothetical protein